MESVSSEGIRSIFTDVIVIPEAAVDGTHANFMNSWEKLQLHMTLWLQCLTNH